MNCTNLLQNQNWGRTCTNYFAAVTLTEEDITNICATDTACKTRVRAWDYAAFYDEYTFNDRPHQTRSDKCNTEQCDSLLENFDYVDLCASNLRSVSESCTTCSSTEFEMLKNKTW